MLPAFLSFSCFIKLFFVWNQSLTDLKTRNDVRISIRAVKQIRKGIAMLPLKKNNATWQPSRMWFKIAEVTGRFLSCIQIRVTLLH